MEENEVLEGIAEEELEPEGIAMELLRDFKEHSRRMDDHNQRLVGIIKSTIISFSAAVVLIVLIFFGGILLFLNQYEFENYSQDGGGYNNINTGEQGDLYNGTEIPENEEEERQSKGYDTQEAVE